MSQRTSDVKVTNGGMNRDAGESESRSGDIAKDRYKDLRAIPSADDEIDSDQGANVEFEEDSLEEEVHKRLGKLEKQNFRMKLALVVLVMVVGYLGFEQVITESTIVRQTLMESRELKLLDNDGNPRLFLRMYSRVPVLQLLDSSGKPRMSLGMRFDDTPFIDLSDRTGRTRATLEMTEKDEPALSLFDENGEPTFKIN